MTLLRCCMEYASKFGKLSSGHRTGKSQFSFQFQRKAMPKNVQTIAQFALIPHTSKVMLKILQARLQCMWTKNFQMFRLHSEDTEEPEIHCQHPLDPQKREFQKNIYVFIDYAKTFDCVITTNCRNGNIRPPYLPSEKSVCRSRSNS